MSLCMAWIDSQGSRWAETNFREDNEHIAMHDAVAWDLRDNVVYWLKPEERSVWSLLCNFQDVPHALLKIGMRLLAQHKSSLNSSLATVTSGKLWVGSWGQKSKKTFDGNSPRTFKGIRVRNNYRTLSSRIGFLLLISRPAKLQTKSGHHFHVARSQTFWVYRNQLKTNQNTHYLDCVGRLQYMHI